MCCATNKTTAINTPISKLTRFATSQRNRTLIHTKLVQPTKDDEERHIHSLSVDVGSHIESSASANFVTGTEMDHHTPSHTFVVCADTQLGSTSLNDEWETELEYSRLAVDRINNLTPRPKYVCVCGDLVDMEHTFYANNPKSKALKNYTKEECGRIQDKQNDDFKNVWSKVHPDIALVCICGNHDIGNRPTPESITRFTNAFGDEYLAFWANGTYNIVLNNVLFMNSEGAREIYDEQLKWLKDQLVYANDHCASQIFVFAHHPWFLYDDEETSNDLINRGGASALPKEWDDGNGRTGNSAFLDVYFGIPKESRMVALDLFRKHNVSACCKFCL